MYSTFFIDQPECSICNNQTLKNLGHLQGVYGAQIDRLKGCITVAHTDEVSKEQIAETLLMSGFKERENVPDTGSV